MLYNKIKVFPFLKFNYPSNEVIKLDIKSKIRESKNKLFNHDGK